MRQYFIKIAGVALAGALVSACGGHDDDDTGNLVEVAQANGFSALLAAATRAGLDDDLSAASANGLTVFAPTNAAFTTLATQLGFADANAMVAALPPSALASILSYHVLPARRTAAISVSKLRRPRQLVNRWSRSFIQPPWPSASEPPTAALPHA